MLSGKLFLWELIIESNSGKFYDILGENFN